jgi:D-xylose transport system substrate-binding protein
VTSARYVAFDAPLLTKAFQSAGLTSSQFTIQNAHGSTSTQFTQAQAAITNGASVIIVDPFTTGVGAHIESYGKQHGVAVIDYDRLTLGGSRSYYVSFNNVAVGTLIGKGLVSCVKAWNVAHPNVIDMSGDPSDNNATLFAQGYNAVMKPYFDAGKWTLSQKPAGTWTPATALSDFQNALTAHSNINAALVPNDENAAPIIKYLQNQKVKPKTFPITGQDATLIGLHNILTGYQCGTAYKSYTVEAQAAAAVALYVRDGQTPPADLVNGTAADTSESNKAVPTVVLKPAWVTASNMGATVVKDGQVTAKQLCTGVYASLCQAAGIS